MFITNNAKIYGDDEAKEGCKENSTPFVRNTASVLTIPRLNPEILRKIEPGTFRANLSTLALNLLRKGLIKEDSPDDLTQMIETAIQKWVLSKTGDIELFDFSIEVRPELDYLEQHLYDESYEEFKKYIQNNYGQAAMFLCIEPGSLPTMTIGETLQKIEGSTEGLGKTAYYWLATCGSRILDIYTPWRGTSIAEHVWWYNADNQEDYVDEISQYYDDDDALAEAMEVSPDNWEAAFPKWVTGIENPLSVNDLKKIVESGAKDSLDVQVAAVLLEIIRNKDAELPDVSVTDLISVYHGIYLHWAENDMSHRLIDDYIQELNNSGGEGYLETLGITPIPCDPMQFRKWMANMEKGWVQIKNIENLIKLIGTRIN